MDYNARLLELQKKFRDCEAKTKLLAGRSKGREMSDAEVVAEETLCDELLLLKGAITETYDQARAAGQPLDSARPGGDGREAVDGGGAGMFYGAQAPGRYVPKVGAVHYDDLFGAPRGDGFTSMRAFLQAVEGNDLSKLRRFTEQPQAKVPDIRGAVKESIPADGGFLIGEQLWKQVWERSLEDQLILPRATVWPMESATLRAPGFSDADRSSTLYGGLVAAFISEGATSTPVDPKFRSILLAAKKLGIYARASSEFNEDVGGANPIDAALPRALAWFMDYFFIRGTGSGQPCGIMNGPATITVAKEGSQANDSIVWQNCVKMYTANSARNRSVWIASDTCLPQLLTMGVAIGTGGEYIPVLKDSGAGLTLLNRPVILTEKLPVLGDAGDLMFCDLSQYIIGVRRQATVEKSNLPSWTSDQVDWRILSRFDGQPAVDSAATRKDAATESPFVILGARG